MCVTVADARHSFVVSTMAGVLIQALYTFFTMRPHDSLILYRGLRLNASKEKEQLNSRIAFARCLMLARAALSPSVVAVRLTVFYLSFFVHSRSIFFFFFFFRFFLFLDGG